jgi:hypothetical protein
VALRRSTRAILAPAVAVLISGCGDGPAPAGTTSSRPGSWTLASTADAGTAVVIRTMTGRAPCETFSAAAHEDSDSVSVTLVLIGHHCDERQPASASLGEPVTLRLHRTLDGRRLTGRRRIDNVILSTGRPPGGTRDMIPDLQGLSLPDARDAARLFGARVVARSKSEHGIVRQTPNPGSAWSSDERRIDVW